MKKLYLILLALAISLPGIAYWLLRPVYEIKYLKEPSVLMQSQDNKLFLVFDFDGTLIESFDYLIHVFNDLADTYNYKKIVPDQHEYIRGLSLFQISKEYGVTWYKLPFVAKKARALMKQQIPNLNPVSGIKEMLQALDASGYCLGILTSNSVENVELFLHKHDLNMFSVICSESGVFNKHHIFGKLKKQLNLAGNKLIYVGDEIRDIDAARKGGVRIISVSWGHNNRDALVKNKPDAIIDSPEQLINTVKGF